LFLISLLICTKTFPAHKHAMKMEMSSTEQICVMSDDCALETYVSNSLYG